MADNQRLHLAVGYQPRFHRPRPRGRHRAAVPRVHPSRFRDVLMRDILSTTRNRPAPVPVLDVGARVGGDAPVDELTLEQVMSEASVKSNSDDNVSNM